MKHGSLTLKVVISLVIIAAIIPIAYQVYDSTWDALFGGTSEEEASESNYQSVVRYMNDLLDQPGYADRVTTIKLAGNHMIVGFDTDSDKVSTRNDFSIAKPDTPACSIACLCLVEGDIETVKAGDASFTCEAFDEDIKFRGGTGTPQLGAPAEENIGDLPEDQRLKARELALMGGAQRPIEYHLSKVEHNGDSYLTLRFASSITEDYSMSVQRCPDTDGTDQLCRDERNFAVVKDEGRSYVCVYDSDIGDCQREQIRPCLTEDGVQHLTERGRCACGDTAHRRGYCHKDGNDYLHAPINCSDVDSCSDYIQGGLPQGEAITYCNQNVCDISDGCSYTARSYTGGMGLGNPGGRCT
jgi:hypothetical protein